MSAIDAISEAAAALRAALPAGSQVILFGSHAKGTATPNSDVDLMVIEPEVNHWLKETDRLYRVLRPFRLPVELVVTSRAIFLEQSSVASTVYAEARQHGREI